MKKIILIILSLSFITLISNTINANVYYRFAVDEVDIIDYEGTRHSQYTGTMYYGETESNQRYNILDFDLNEDDVHLITISAYENYRW